MLEKKLLTLGGAIAILALGACLLPPPRPHRRPPAPALPPYLARIHYIAIQVEDRSASSPIDLAPLNHAVGDEMNNLWKESSIHFLGPPPGPAPDATLKILIRQKSAYPLHTEPGPRSW